MPHPFKNKGIPISLIDFDPAQFQKPKKSFAFDEIASEVRDHSGKGYGLNFINENYEAFIKKYIELAQSSYFSYALVWELKVEYLEQLHEYCKSEYRQDARYAIFEEETGWTIIFDRKPIRGLKSKGFQHIYFLMASKNKKIDTYDLYNLNGAPLEERKYSEYRRVWKGDNDNINQGFKILGKERDRMPLIDNKAKRSYEKKLRELKLQINKAKSNNDLNQLQFLNQQFDFIEEELKKTSYEGRAKTFSDESDTIRKTVVKRIERALKEIKGGKKAKSKFRKKVSEYFKNALGVISLNKNSFKDDIDWFIG